MIIQIYQEAELFTVYAWSHPRFRHVVTNMHFIEKYRHTHILMFLRKSARTGKLNTSFRTIVRKIVVLVQGYYLQIPWYTLDPWIPVIKNPCMEIFINANTELSLCLTAGNAGGRFLQTGISVPSVKLRLRIQKLEIL